MSKPYRFEYCIVCKRQLIVQNVDGWTGKQLPHGEFYVCDDCKRKQKIKKTVIEYKEGD